MPGRDQLIARVDVALLVSADGQSLIVDVVNEGKRDYSLVIPTRYVRILAAGLSRAIDDRPDLFPLAGVNLVTPAGVFKPS